MNNIIIEKIIYNNYEIKNNEPVNMIESPIINENIELSINKSQNNNEIVVDSIEIDEPIKMSDIDYTLDQDNKQRISVGFQFLFELYRVVTSSLLILFVPQMCVDHVCTINENLVWVYPIYNITLVLNFTSMFSLFTMYVIEIQRENILIKYLHVNLELPNDNSSVGNKLTQITIQNSDKIYKIDKYYQLSSYIASFIYTLNIMFSAAVVNHFYAGGQTLSTFITYVLFMATKLYSVYTITSTEKNIFYSAYMKTNVQFNDIDTNYKIVYKY